MGKFLAGNNNMTRFFIYDKQTWIATSEFGKIKFKHFTALFILIALVWGVINLAVLLINLLFIKSGVISLIFFVSAISQTSMQYGGRKKLPRRMPMACRGA